MYLNPATTVALVTNVVNNGSGLFRVTAPFHGRVTGDRVYIFGIVGNPTANGYWTVTRIDDNTFDLQGSTFSGTYSTDGTVATADRIVAKLDGNTTTNPVVVMVSYKVFDFASAKISSIGRKAVQLTTTSNVEVYTQYSSQNSIIIDDVFVLNEDTTTKTPTVAIDNGKWTETLLKAELLTNQSYIVKANSAPEVLNNKGAKI